MLGKRRATGGSGRRGLLAGAAVPALALAALVTQAALVTPTANAEGTTVERRVHQPHTVSPEATAAPTGLGPAQVKEAYGFPTGSTAGAGEKVAVVAPFDAPTIEADLAVFSQRYGLPACTTANGCFKKVNDKGGKTTYPSPNKAWAMEISMDVEWVHAIAPGARILLVEAASDRLADVIAAEDYATAHAPYVSNSLGVAEFSGETAFDSHFSRPGVSVFVASGDDGAADGPGYPASAPGVIAVGATTLLNIGQPTFAEQGWDKSGGGCSVYEAAGTAQRAYPSYAAVGCDGQRAVPDVSLVGDPHSGVSVYDSYKTANGWFVAGGTSASTPMWAARAADSGLVITPKLIYSATSPITFRDVTVGNNGQPALPGYDLVTGLGSWTGSKP